MGKKFLLNFAPTGMIPMRATTPSVPILPEEIVDQVAEAAGFGANMVHLHARDAVTGKPTFQKEVYAEIINGIRRQNKEIIICVSTSGRSFPEFAHRSEVLELSGDCKPDFASLTLSSLNFENQSSLNCPEMIKKLAQKMLDHGIHPELEAFDLGMINYSKYLIRKGYIQPPHYFNLILGNIAGAQADLLHLGLMIRELPKESIWSAGGFGPAQLIMNTASLIMGGGVRTGLEDNIWLDEGKTIVATNQDLVKGIVGIANALGYTPYSGKEARQLLGV